MKDNAATTRSFGTLPDLTGLAPGPAVAELRDLGVAGVRRALGMALERPVSAPHFGSWLDHQTASGFAARSSLRRLKQAMIFDDPTELPPLPSGIVSAELVPFWPMRALDWLGRKTQGRLGTRPRPASLGQENFADALAAQAFLSGDYRAELARAVHLYLSNKVIFYPDPDPIPMFSTATLCHLVTGFAEFPTWSAAARESLTKLAVGLDTQPQWASFWDMWLLEQASQQRGFNPVCPLPLLRIVDIVPHAEAELAVDPRVRPDWAQARPHYIDFLNQGLP